MRVFILFLMGLLFGQMASAQISSQGKDFWFGYMFNNTPDPTIGMVVGAKLPANVKIEVFETGEVINLSLRAGASERIVLDAGEQAIPMMALGSDKVQSKAIHVTSDSPINVIGFISSEFSSDSFVVKPTASLGYEYYGLTHQNLRSSGRQGIPGGNPSEIMIVATADDTDILITPSQNVGQKRKGVPYEITLNAGDVYQIQAVEDLTGTLIESSDGPGNCKPFAVFAGNTCVTVDFEGLQCGGCDYLATQITPNDLVGARYVSIPVRDTIGYVVKALAIEDNTQVTVGGETKQMNKGEAVTFEVKKPTLVEANQPILASRLQTSASCNKDFYGDPSLIMLDRLELPVREVYFNTLDVDEDFEYNINVIVHADGLNDVAVNNRELTFREFDQIEGTSYWYTRIQTFAGRANNIESEHGLHAFVDGAGTFNSYAHDVGFDEKIVEADFTISNTGKEPDTNRACIEDTFMFEGFFVNLEGFERLSERFSFIWDFGDGNSSTGKFTTHSYVESGEYEVTLTVTDCFKPIIVKYKVIAESAETEGLEGPTSICPFSTGVAYSIEGSPDNTYTVEVSGGILVSQDGQNIVIDWGDANPNAYIRVLAKSPLDCQATPFIQPIEVTYLIEPATPVGNDLICRDQLIHTYSTPSISNTTFTWNVIGGVIRSGQGTNEVEVEWNGQGNGNIYFEQATTIGDDVCRGVSPILIVSYYPLIELEDAVTNVSCNGANDGQLNLVSRRGHVFKEVMWEDGTVGPIRENLPPGEYRVTITTQTDCKESFVFTITEPEVLTASLDTRDILCFNGTDGQAIVTAKGGTQPYSVYWDDATSIGTMQNMGLSVGGHNMKLVDANGCEVSLDFEIAAPPLLEADLASLVNDPICPQTSNGYTYIEAKGGVPDYEFYWSSNDGESPESSNLNQGTYTVRIVDANGCETSLEVEVTERFPKMLLPNAFSPNGDGENDTFKPATDCEMQFNMQIFNEWGSVIFSTDDIDQGWDGNYRGSPVQNGRYGYMIFYTVEVNGNIISETLRGKVNLIR